MYAEFSYYSDEEGYGGTLIKEEEKTEYRRFAKKADNYINTVTGNKLLFAFPEDDRTVEAVKDCACEIIEFLYRIEKIKNNAAMAAGYITEKDGTMKGKIVKSISSGSESVTFTGSENSINTKEIESARSSENERTEIYSIIREYLAGKSDANGVNLLYAGPYPGRM